VVTNPLQLRSDWVSGRDPDWRDRVEVAALDPFRGYATALRIQLPAAVRVLDAFHVTRLGLAALDDVRRRVQQQTLHRRGHRHDPLYRIRSPAHPETLSERAWSRLETGLVLGDPRGEVTTAWMAAHELRYLYRGGRDLPDARRRLHDLLQRCVFSDVPELLRLARTQDAVPCGLAALVTALGQPPVGVVGPAHRQGLIQFARGCTAAAAQVEESVAPSSARCRRTDDHPAARLH
jgi:Transposase